MQTKMASVHGDSAPIKIALIIGVCAFALVFGLIVALGGNRPTVYSIKNGNFSISTSYGETIKLTNIEKVELKSSLPANLSRTDGYGSGNIIKGKCSSDIGNVTVYLDTSVKPYIYLTTTSGIVILNNQSAGKTRTLYQQLVAAVPQE